MADVLIAGGGIAGCTAAILLGRLGLSVEVYERDRFPREKPCGEGLLPAGVDVLRRLGLATVVGGRPFHGIRYRSAARVLEWNFPTDSHGSPYGLAQRRRHLDRILFEQAADTVGVRVHTGYFVERAVVANGRVIGLQVNGSLRKAHWVIAADGARSLLAHQLGVAIRQPSCRVGFRAHFRLPTPTTEQHVEVILGSGYELYLTPLPEGELAVAALAEAHQARGKRIFYHWLAAQGLLADRLRGAHQVSELRAAAPLALRVRSGWVPGLILLGDAAGAVDPITGMGMTHALLTSELLARHLQAAGRLDEEVVCRFDRERRRMLRTSAWLSRLLIRASRHPRALMTALDLIQRAPRLRDRLAAMCTRPERSASIRPRWAGRRLPPRAHL